MSPEKMWRTAVEQGGLSLEFASPALAVSRRHMLHRYRNKVGDDALYDFHIQLAGKVLKIIPVGTTAKSLDGQEVEVDNPFLNAAKGLKVDL